MSKTAPSAKDSPSFDILRNRCNKIGTYFLCEQVLNNKPAGLLIFIRVEGMDKVVRLAMESGMAEKL